MEMMIAVAILGIVMVSVTSFMITGSRSFAKGSADAELQKEAEQAVNQIEDLIIDTNGGISKEVTSPGTENEETVVTMYHIQLDDGTGTSESVKETVTFKKADGQITYDCEQVAQNADTGAWESAGAVYTNQLLAENVESFDMDLSDTVEEYNDKGEAETLVRSVTITVGYRDSAGRAAYATSPIITLRNRLLLSNDPQEILDDTPRLSDAFELWYSGLAEPLPTKIIDGVSEVERGLEYNIYAYLSFDATTNINDLVQWEIKDAVSGDASHIDSDTGVLHVGYTDPHEYLTVVARYKSNPNKKAEGTLKLIGGEVKSLTAVHITEQSMTAFNPTYGTVLDLTGRWTPEEIANTTYKWTVSEPSWVEPFTDNTKNLTLQVKKDAAYLGKNLSITVEAHSNVTGETRYDTVTYHIPEDPGVGGNSSMKRGQTEGQWHNNMFYSWSTNFGYDVTCTNIEYYFCNLDGDRISAYDDLLQYVHIKFNLDGVSNWSNHEFPFYVGYDEGLPLNQSYNVMVVAHMHDPVTGEDWDHEQMFHVPAVKIYDLHTYSCPVNPSTDDVYFKYEFDLVGYWSVSMQNSSDVIASRVEELEYEAPDGVDVNVELFAPVAMGSPDDANKMQGSGHISVTGRNWDTPHVVYTSPMKIRVYMKNYPDVYGTITLYFSEGTS